MIHQTCTCGARWKLPAGSEGKRAKCKKCGDVFLVTSSSSAAVSRPDDVKAAGKAPEVPVAPTPPPIITAVTKPRDADANAPTPEGRKEVHPAAIYFCGIAASYVVMLIVMHFEKGIGEDDFRPITTCTALLPGLALLGWLNYGMGSYQYDRAVFKLQDAGWFMSWFHWKPLRLQARFARWWGRPVYRLCQRIFNRMARVAGFTTWDWQPKPYKPVPFSAYRDHWLLGRWKTILIIMALAVFVFPWVFVAVVSILKGCRVAG